MEAQLQDIPDIRGATKIYEFRVSGMVRRNIIRLFKERKSNNARKAYETRIVDRQSCGKPFSDWGQALLIDLRILCVFHEMLWIFIDLNVNLIK